MSNVIYEASVYSRKITYRNFKGEEREFELFFALDPLQLMQVIAGIKPKQIKSGNPARNGQDQELSDEDQLKMIRDLAIKAAGEPSADGESWTPFVDFEDTLVGKAFLTKLASSDGDRREFSQKVILDPFRAFINYAIADETNTPSDVQQFKSMLSQMENIFKAPEEKTETLEEKKARLAAELEAINGPTEDAGA